MLGAALLPDAPLAVVVSVAILHFVPGMGYLLYIPITAYLFETLVFFFSPAARQKIVELVGNENVVQAAIQGRKSETNRYRISRLAGADTDCLKKKLKRAMEVEKLYRDDLTLAELADYIHLSEKALSELLNSKMNQSFYGMLNQYRALEASRLLLEQPERTVLSIGYEAGFKSLSTFNNAFLRIMGMTPGKFRNSKLNRI